MRFWSVVAVALCCGAQLFAASNPFLEKPYLQLGDNPRLAAKESLTLLWHTASDTGKWSVEIGEKGKFRIATSQPSIAKVALKGTPKFYVYTMKLTGLKPGAAFDYRVRLDGEVVFTASGMARPAASAKSYRFIAFGDSGADKPEQKEIAALTHKLNPGMVFHTGDIVYSRGLVSEYKKHHFSIYNADAADAKVGAPLTRSVVMIPAAGNHDVATRDLNKYPDALAYFYYWSLPLNGLDWPVYSKLDADADRIRDFRTAAGANFPRTLNYSFDWGNSHWLVLDSNNYTDWSNAEFQKWVAADLAASKAVWKFVGLHHPGFNSSKAHFTDQQVRLMSPVFEKYGVDVVFAGHVHNYQRSYPLTFMPKKWGDLSKSREVAGDWTLDRDYDGVTKTKPRGVIYLVTGAGGNSLYNGEQETDPKTWQPFTLKFISKIHSLTDVEITGKRAVFKQYDRTGAVIDQFVLTK